MEEVRVAAMAYYVNMPADQKQAVQDFYRSLDVNGDGKVTSQEYLYALKKAGLDPKILPSNLFEVLDKNNDGTLDLEECVTFYYMIVGSRLVACDGCGSYMLGLHFLCVECYCADEKTTYDLCCSCYRNNNFNHAHSYFLDNFALLRRLRTALLEGNASAGAEISSYKRLWLSDKLGLNATPEVIWPNLPSRMHQQGMIYPEMSEEEWFLFMKEMSPNEINWRHAALNIPDMATNSAGFERMVIAGLSSFTFYIPGCILRQLGISHELNRAGEETFHIPAFTAQNLTGYEHNWGLRQLGGADLAFSTTLKDRYKAWLRKEVVRRQNIG